MLLWVLTTELIAQKGLWTSVIANIEDGLHPQCIIVQGAPGSGKTTFAYEVCKKWAENQILRQFSMVILLPLRDKSIQIANKLEDLLTHDSFEIQKMVNRAIEKNAGEGILLLLEGFDELPEEKRSESSLFMKLICGKILPLATMMVTSCPWAISPLLRHYSHRISQHIEIIGFSKINIIEYISQAFSDADEQQVFQQYLELYPHMEASMNIPINCAIVVEVYRSLAAVSTGPKTMTQLYQALVMTLLLRYLMSHPNYRNTQWTITRFEDLPNPIYQQLKQISQLAYTGMMNFQQLIFSDLPSNFETLGLLQKVAEFYPHRGQSVSYNFLHLTLQEFLAAYHISLMDNREQERHFLEFGYLVKDMKSYLPSCFLGYFLQFLSGLGGLNNADVILKDELEVNTLYTCLFKYDNTLLTFDVLGGSVYEMHASTLCQWLFESQDESLIAKVYGNLHRVEKVRYNSPHNMYALGYCIAKSQCSWELNTAYPPYILCAPSKSCATDSHLEMLYKRLSVADGGRGHFTVINLQSNRFTSAGVLLLQGPHYLLEKLTELDLSQNRIDSKLCNGLTEMLCLHLFPHLRRVSLENNPIPSGGCLQLIKASTITPSLSEVVLPHLNADECKPLMSIHHITVLVLSAPEKDALAVVALAMQQNTTLKELGLQSTEFSELTISTLCTALSNNRVLKVLDLQSSTIPGIGCDYLGAMLTVNTTLEKLSLLFASTSKGGIVKLVRSLESNSTLRELWIFEDYEDCVRPLMKKLYVKDRLHIDWCP